MLTCLDSGWQRAKFDTVWANVCSFYGRKFIPDALERTKLAIAEGETVVVHCMRGRHRTGAFVAALKVRVTYHKPYRLRYYKFVAC